MTPGVVIYTDGACSGNPGPGGWGAVLRYSGKTRELCGGETHTTNNRMEMMAAIGALEALKRPVSVRVYTDSTYLEGGVSEWMRRWKANGWKTAHKTPVKNTDLWLRLDALLAGLDVEWRWIKGHSGDPGNERADALARRGMAPFAPARKANPVAAGKY